MSSSLTKHEQKKTAVDWLRFSKFVLEWETPIVRIGPISDKNTYRKQKNWCQPSSLKSLKTAKSTMGHTHTHTEGMSREVIIAPRLNYE